MNKSFVRVLVVLMFVIVFVAPAILAAVNTIPQLPDLPLYFEDAMVGRITVVYPDGRSHDIEVEMKYSKNYPLDLHFDKGVTYFHVGTHPNIEWAIEDNGSSYQLEPLSGGWYKINVYDLSEYPGIFFVELSNK